MSKIYEVMLRFKMEVAIHDEDTSIADYMDDFGYDFQTHIDMDADIQHAELLDYDILKERDVDQSDLFTTN